MPILIPLDAEPPEVVMKGKLLIAIGVVAALFAIRALTADEINVSFDALDRDKDGVITASEARANPAVATRFAAADKNEDGYLSRSEFNEMRKQ